MSEEYMNPPEPRKLKIGDTIPIYKTAKQTFKLLQMAGYDGILIEKDGYKCIEITEVPDERSDYQGR